MGTDTGPETVLDGAAMAISGGLKSTLALVGDEAMLQPLIDARPALAQSTLLHASQAVTMEDKPAQILRRGRETSMWQAIASVSEGNAHAVVSGGNTGALMAVARHQLRMVPHVDRPAITALWPTPRGRSVVLDVGANVDVNADQLVQFAVMGAAFFRALTKTENPSVGL